MIRKIALILLLLCVVALAPFFIDEKGYVLISMGDYTYEFTVVGIALLCTFALFIIWFILWLTKSSLNLSFKAWRSIAFSSTAKAKRNFQKGLAAYLLGDFSQAEQLMAKCAQPSGLANSAWLIAADCAQKLGDKAASTNYLQFINDQDEAQENFSFETLLVAGRLNVADQQFLKARELIDNNHKLVGHDIRLQCLEVDVCLQEGRFAKAAEYLQKVRKDKSIEPMKVYQWDIKTFTGLFNQIVTETNTDALISHFNGLSRKEKQSEGIVLAYITCLNKHGLPDKIDSVVAPLLKKGTNEVFINHYKLLPIKHSQNSINIVQKILVKNPENVMWLSTLAHMCYANKEFEKSNKAFCTLLKIEQNPDDLQGYAKVLEQIGEYQQATLAYQRLLS